MPVTHVTDSNKSFGHARGCQNGKALILLQGRKTVNSQLQYHLSTFLSCVIIFLPIYWGNVQINSINPVPHFIQSCQLSFNFAYDK